MCRTMRWFGIAIGLCASVQAQQSPLPGTDYPVWAFPLKVERPLPREESRPKTLPGSSKAYTQQQIDDLANTPDWFPEQHAVPPLIVLSGHGDALACSACHLTSGLGHPESADLTGLSVDYMIEQMKDFKSGARVDVPRMNKIAKATSDEESQQAAEWFATLKPMAFTRVVETDAVPRSFVGDGRMRFAEPDGSVEPIGNRIITLPEDQARARMRDPWSGFVAYVPVGSVTKGKALVQIGDGPTMPCATCHGPELRGIGNVPRLAGIHPIYIARQLFRFRDGTRNGAQAVLMKPVAASLSDEDIVNVAAYLGSLAP